jgi:mRNA-degrading endonuclease RelE of RelBE toxin-antitoxin system
MNVEVVVSDNFRKEAKKYLKKFHSLKQELLDLELSLQENPKQGAPLAGATYKIRLASKSKGKGKSGGFRIITYLVEHIEDENGEPFIVVTLLSIYDKSEVSTLSETQISSLVANYLLQQPRLDE